MLDPGAHEVQPAPSYRQSRRGLKVDPQMTRFLNTQLPARGWRGPRGERSPGDSARIQVTVQDGSRAREQQLDRSPRRSGFVPVLGATIVLACLAPGAWPDSVDMAQAQGGGFALDAARSFFTYVPSLGLNGRRSWTEGQLSEIQGWSARIRRAGTRGLLAINVLEERRSPQPSSAEVGPFGTREIVDPTAAGEAGRREAEFGLSLSLDMLGLEEQSKEPLSSRECPKSRC